MSATLTIDLPEDVSATLGKAAREEGVQEGWKALVAKLGVQKATQFVVLLERGKGDSVKEIKDYWGNTSIDEIYNRVANWKASQL